MRDGTHPSIHLSFTALNLSPVPSHAPSKRRNLILHPGNSKPGSVEKSKAHATLGINFDLRLFPSLRCSNISSSVWEPKLPASRTASVNLCINGTSNPSG